MKTLLVLATLALVVAAPGLVDARHIGPCTHEYGEAARTLQPKIILQTAVECLDRVPCLFDACVLP